MYYRPCLRFLSAIIVFSFVYNLKVMTGGLVCRKVLRNSLFEFQGESQGRTKAQDTPHTSCIYSPPQRLAVSGTKCPGIEHGGSRLNVLDCFQQVREALPRYLALVSCQAIT